MSRSTPSTPVDQPTLAPDVVARCQDEEYRQGYAKGYSDAISVIMERCEFLLARSAALADLRNFAADRCEETGMLLDRVVMARDVSLDAEAGQETP